jgi:hypothetical protein
MPGPYWQLEAGEPSGISATMSDISYASANPADAAPASAPATAGAPARAESVEARLICILPSFAPQGCGRKRGVGAAYRVIRMKRFSGYMMVRGFVEGLVCAFQRSWRHKRSRLVTAPWNVIVRVSVPFGANLRQKLICLLSATSRV